MTKLLNEVQAWRRIARDIEKGACKHLTGLCLEIQRLRVSSRIAADTAYSMQRRVDTECRLMPGFNGGYAFPSGEKSTRIMAAQFFALEAADEARAAR